MEIDLKKILFLLKKNLVLIISLSLAFLISAFIFTKLFITPMYTTSVKLYVDSSNSNGTTNINELNYAQKVVNTYIEMINTNDFYKKVNSRANTNMSLSEIKKSISFAVVNNTEIFSITAKTDSPTKSKLLADTASIVAIETIAELKQSSKINVVSSAPLPTSPSSPNIKLNCAIGFFIGLFLSFIISLLKDSLNVKIKNEEDLENNYDIPILGVIPYFEQIAEERAKAKTENKEKERKNEDKKVPKKEKERRNEDKKVQKKAK